MKIDKVSSIIIRVFAKKHGFDMIEVFKDQGIPVKLLSDVIINGEQVHSFEILIYQNELSDTLDILEFYGAYDYIADVRTTA